MVQLVGPVGVIRVLKLEPLGQRRRQGDFAAVLAHGAAQGIDRIVVLAPRRVVPSGNGDRCEADVASGHGMRPGFLRKRADRVWSAPRGGGAQERADDGEAKPRPAGTCRFWVCVSHHVSSETG